MASSPKTLLLQTSRVIGIVVSEENVLIEEIFSFELLFLGEGIQRLVL